jgi:hypothetical protein
MAFRIILTMSGIEFPSFVQVYTILGSWNYFCTNNFLISLQSNSLKLSGKLPKELLESYGLENFMAVLNKFLLSDKNFFTSWMHVLERDLTQKSFSDVTSF